MAITAEHPLDKDTRQIRRSLRTTSKMLYGLWWSSSSECI